MRQLTIWAVLFLVLANSGYGAETAFVELVAPKDSSPWVGQRVTFAVDVVVEGRFSGSTLFDLPQVSGVILMKPEGRPVLSTRTIDDIEYTVQRHEFALFCQKDGQITIPGFTVRCGSTEAYGQPTQEHTLSIPSLSVTARLPSDAKQGQILVTTTNFDIRETWTPTPGEAKIGDAFARTITMRAADVPGMLLPRIPTPKSSGVAIYAAAPQVTDRTERGEFTGIRTETLTYICETAGLVEIPAVLVRWWNPSGSVWGEKTLPAVVLKIATATARGVSATGGKAGRLSRYWPVWLVLAAVACVLGWIMARHRHPDAETVLFKECLQACREGDALWAYNAVTQWRAAAGLSHETPPQSVNAGLKFSHRLIVGLENAWQGTQLEKALKSWRRMARRKTVRIQGGLPDLNPHG